MTLSIAEKTTRKDTLLGMGFSEKTVGEIGTHSSGCHINIKDVRARLDNLRELGFTDPAALIEKCPVILGLAQNKVVLTARLLEIFGHPCNVKKMTALCTKNIESLLLASLRARDYTELMCFRKDVKGSTREKRTRIYMRMDELDDEIARLYQERHGLKGEFGE